MTATERQQLIALVNREVLPAIGCTEPAAVALACAKAAETLGAKPAHITVYLSSNVLKNAMGVGIPGTGTIGLPIAVALGMLVGKSEYQLEVLKNITPEALAEGQQMVADKMIDIYLKDDTEDKLYIEAVATAGANEAVVKIVGQHTNIIYVAKNGEVLTEITSAKKNTTAVEVPELSMRKVYDFATTAPLDEIRFILQSGEVNKAAAIRSLKENYGHALGKMLVASHARQTIGDSLFTHILSCTSAACDARMAGAMIPVMSNSGSGNQGIAATVPVMIYAEETGRTTEQLIRALMLSQLTAIYIKTHLGRLSALCGCVVAGTGSSCGITYLMGGGYEQVSYTVKNMIANITGMICDGAKPSCALKVCTGIATAVFSAMMAMDNKTVTSLEGIIDDDVDRTIRNLAHIGANSMNETDKAVLQIMTGK